MRVSVTGKIRQKKRREREMNRQEDKRRKREMANQTDTPTENAKNERMGREGDQPAETL